MKSFPELFLPPKIIFRLSFLDRKPASVCEEKSLGSTNLYVLNGTVWFIKSN